MTSFDTIESIHELTSLMVEIVKQPYYSTQITDDDLSQYQSNGLTRSVLRLAVDEIRNEGFSTDTILYIKRLLLGMQMLGINEGRSAARDHKREEIDVKTQESQRQRENQRNEATPLIVFTPDSDGLLDVLFERRIPTLDLNAYLGLLPIGTPSVASLIADALSNARPAISILGVPSFELISRIKTIKVAFVIDAKGRYSLDDVTMIKKKFSSLMCFKSDADFLSYYDEMSERLSAEILIEGDDGDD